MELEGNLLKMEESIKVKQKLELFIKEVLYKMKAPLLIIAIVQKVLVR